VEGRKDGNLARRSLEGEAKRAAFASYYAPLHWLTTFHLARALPDAVRTAMLGASEILDLGCGSGAVAAALAEASSDPGEARRPRVVGIDRSGFALDEARSTFRCFGLRARLVRAELPGPLPPGGAQLAAAGWSLNELSRDAFDRSCDWLSAHLAGRGSILVIEPLARAAAPWWAALCERLAPLGARSGEWRAEVALPDWIAQLDRASGLDHSTLSARWLAGARVVTSESPRPANA
jgi:SAM-dependent methyltransferase